MRYIDLFAGLGGSTTGLLAAGHEVVWAANHWPVAVHWHAANHPEVPHACQDLRQADWRDCPRPDAVWASPACQGHSRARGVERPHHDASRSTAWAVVDCLEHHRPPVVVVENVPEFRRWSLYSTWRQALETLGYVLTEHLWDAADAGVPQSRVRLYVVGVRARHGLELPAPELPHRPASEVVDFDAGRWAPVRRAGRAAATLARIERAQREHGPRCLMPYYGSARGGRSLARPLGTVTTRDRWALVDGERMRMLLPSELRAAMGFPTTTRLPERPRRLAVHLLGNAVVPPMAEWIARRIAEAA